MPEFKPVFKRLKSNSTWEEMVGYCRAVQAGPFISVSGTTAIGEDGQTFYPFNAYQQTKKCLDTIENALKKFGAKKDHIVRTRMYVTQMDQWQEVGKAHREFFDTDEPAATMVEVNALIRKDMVVEIEVDAFLAVY